MSGGAVTSTLRHVTDRKLAKLAENRRAFEAQKTAMLSASSKADNAAEKVRILIAAFKDNKIAFNEGQSSVKNIERFLDQVRHDPSVSLTLLAEWKGWLEQSLDVHTDKYNYADLFGRLVTEWIENPSDAMSQLNSHSSATKEDLPEAASASSGDASDSFDVVGREEMHEQRQTLEQFIFNEPKVDTAALKKYLDDLFVATKKSKRMDKTPLERLRDDIGKWKGDISVGEDTIRWAIKGILKGDLFTGQKREVLVDLKSRPEVIKEMVDVLRMDLDSLKNWEWPGPVPVLLRRQLNGKYRAYMDEEIHTAILIQVIGAHIAVMLKDAFRNHYYSGAWVQAPYRAMKRADRQRRHYFLGKDNIQSSDSVRDIRFSEFRDDFFMTQLPSKVNEGGREYMAEDDDVDSEYGDTKSPVEIKQQLLRLASTEMLINTKLYDEFTILASDFKWFGPSLPHATIFTVLEYFGLKNNWLDFIKKFLAAPLVFTQDGPNAEAKIRKNGIPMGHVLADALGEAVLFCLDFAVHRTTGGAVLYRFHDDIWFWGQESTCVKAWQALQEFSSVTGLELNAEKTAAVKIVSPDKQSLAPLHQSLPTGTVRWGFLKLDPNERRWIIDQEQVAVHVQELSRQLKSCNSVFGWIQAWNGYVGRFFSTNFGQPAHCLGREHVNMCIKAFEHIQRSLFAESGAGNVVEYLRTTITKRFGNSEAITGGRPIPDAFFHFPVELGGLGLLDPFVQLYAMRSQRMRKNTIDELNLALERERGGYEDAKELFEAGDVPVDPSTPKNLEGEPFMSLDEYMRFVEQTASELSVAYRRYLEPIEEIHVDESAKVSNAMEHLPADRYSTQGMGHRWSSLSPYWKWIIALYAGETDKRFGGLAICDKGLLPLGLISILRSERVRWQG
ncbi:reverse transcriptase [Diplodia corticola]|uniref:Reverse transcriptase n=1 Tax=Diplodia corticola TaxID=236234 RepID=A0A1J9S279_9PEZI|nr:reverse transcriptase [Diplodia corticola]OJD34679.1 reverse transcriptase [Diplodia corticola]